MVGGTYLPVWSKYAEIMRNRTAVTSIYKASIKFSARTEVGSVEKYMFTVNTHSERIMADKPIKAVICDGFLIRFMVGSLFKTQGD